jgi:antitoxin component of MazEF toxin-antitoxin module
MGYVTKIQRVDRPTNQSFYFNLPAALGQSLEIEKGEEFEWIIENKNLLILKRLKPPKKRKLKNAKD